MGGAVWSVDSRLKFNPGTPNFGAEAKAMSVISHTLTVHRLICHLLF
jgi:hypothetical protein